MTTLLQDYLTETTKKYFRKTAIVCGNTRVSYQTINAESDALASTLVALGVTRGDRVIISLGNCIEAVIAFWAVLKADAIVSIVHHEIKPDKLAYILQDSGAKILFVNSLTSINDAKVTELDSLKNIIHLNDVIDNYPDDFLLSYAAAIKNGFSTKKYRCKNIDLDLASIIYTSGSTGEPKGVMLTHRNMLSAEQAINAYLENTSDDIIISALPLSFDYGLYQMIMAFAVGATLVLERDMLLPSQFLNRVIAEQVTAVPGVPTLFALLAEYYSHVQHKKNFSSVRYATNTGAAISQKQIASIATMFPNAKVYSMYGLTECKRCTYLPPKDIKHKSTSVGIAIPNTEIWIVDDDGKRLDANQIGQLVIRGATIMRGYWNQPDATLQKLKDGPLPGEKILYTGDYGWLDNDGYFYFHCRMDETFKCRGEKVSPKEIEDVIHMYPGVNEVAVIGVSDEQLGTVGHAFLTKNVDVQVSQQDILNFCRQKLENAKVPATITIVTHLPKTANGKINKQALREQI